MLARAFYKQKKESIHELVYFYCLVLLVIGLPTSRFLVTMSQIVIALNWILEGNYKEKVSKLLNNKAALALASIFLVWVVGMLYTSDLLHGISYDLKNKLPFFTFPLVVASSKPLTAARVKLLPLLFGFAVLIVSFIGSLIFTTNSFIDTRHLSPFTVHIFYGQMVLVSIFLIPWAVRQTSQRKLFFFLSLLTSVWLLFFLFLLSSLTVLVSLVTVVLFLSAREFFFGRNMALRIVSGTAVAAFVAISIVILNTILAPLIMKIEPESESLLQLTSLGNEYHHDQDILFRENGHLVFWFIAHQELEEAWNERSSIKFDSLDTNENHIEYTIYRYLSSKGLKKDRLGVEALSPSDIEAIENGIANYLYLDWPNFFVRIHQSFWELQQYSNTGNPSGYSIAQRIELWRASLEAVGNKPLLGWGTGDVLQALNFGLDSINSELENRNMKPHNQFLVWLIMVGVIGTLIILGLIYFFIVKSKSYRHLPMQVMLVALFVTMFSDMPFDYIMGINLVLFTFVYFGIILNNSFKDNAL